MTDIKYRRNEDHVRISIHGHAGFLPGNDPVCGGISAISCQLLNVLEYYQGKGFISDLATEAISGSMILDFQVKAPTVWGVTWDIIRIGYEAIANEYPENLRLDVPEEDSK